MYFYIKNNWNEMNNKQATCKTCSLDLYKAWIRSNWRCLGPLKQLSRVVCFPQEIIEKIGCYLVPKHHYITHGIKMRTDDGDLDNVNKTRLICRNCLAIGIALCLKQNNCLPYLRCHIGYFIQTSHCDTLEPNELLQILDSELPEYYNCTYYRTRNPIFNEGEKAIITSL